MKIVDERAGGLAALKTGNTFMWGSNLYMLIDSQNRWQAINLGTGVETTFGTIQTIVPVNTKITIHD